MAVWQEKKKTKRIAWQKGVPRGAGVPFRVEAAAPGSLSCQLFDALGKRVLDQRPGAETAPLQLGAQDSHTLHPIPYTLTLDVSDLPSGIYFLRVSSGGYAVSRSVAFER